MDVLKAVEDKVKRKHEENDEKRYSDVPFKVTLQMLIPEEKFGYVVGSKFRTLKRIQVKRAKIFKDFDAEFQFVNILKKWMSS